LSYRCVYHAAVLSRRAAASKSALADFAGFGDLPGVVDLVAEVADASLDYPELIAGVEATLRTLIIARCAPTLSLSSHHSLHLAQEIVFFSDFIDPLCALTTSLFLSVFGPRGHV
jgi:hypothetical protein